MKTSLVSSSLLAIATACLGGCGMSPSYWVDEVGRSSDQQVCFAATETRDFGGWPVKKGVAQKEVEKRKIACDEPYYAKVHYLNDPTRATQYKQDQILGNAEAERLKPVLTQPTQPASYPNCVTKNEAGVFKTECK
jgi:hypothetical protein